MSYLTGTDAPSPLLKVLTLGLHLWELNRYRFISSFFHIFLHYVYHQNVDPEMGHPFWELWLLSVVFFFIWLGFSSFVFLVDVAVIVVLLFCSPSSASCFVS